MARESDKIRQEPEAEQGRRKNIREEYGTPRGKCTAKRRIWGRIVWRKRRTNNMESRRRKPIQ